MFTAIINMNTPNPKYFYDEQKIEKYLKEKDRFNLRLSIIWWDWVSKQTIWKDVCDIKKKQVEIMASDSKNKTEEMHNVYDLVLGSADRKFISWYRSLISTLVNSFKKPKYISQEESSKEQIIQNFDYKAMLENRLWKPFIYKLDYLVKKYILDIGYQLLTIEHIIKLINEWKIDDIKVKIDEDTEEIIKRFSMNRYDSSWELKN